MIQTIKTSSGKLSVIEFDNFIFAVNRIFYIYDIPAGDLRGGHAHISCKQYIISLTGAFDVDYNDGSAKGTIHLDAPWLGYYIKPGTWVDLKNFTSGAVALVLCSEPYDEDDYIRNYDKFLEYSFANTPNL